MDKPKEQFTGNSTTQPGRAIVGSLAPPIGTLDDASLDDLRRAWRRLFHCEPPKISRDLLARHIGYHLQERRHGGLGKATKRKLKTLARSFQSTGQVNPDAGELSLAGCDVEISEELEPFLGEPHRWQHEASWNVDAERATPDRPF